MSQWSAHILSLFPDMFPGPLDTSILGRARKDGLWSLVTHNLREFSFDKHSSVDGPPVGGGAGMVLRADVVGHAIDEIKSTGAKNLPLIYPSPRGRPFTQQKANEWARGDGLFFLCGRFEGLDQRAIDAYEIEEVSLGDFVLAGGEVAAMAMLEATLRQIPGVLGSGESLDEESFSNGLLEYPQYTKPIEWKERKVPDILLSGHHENIRKWRAEESIKLTRARRPDLLPEILKK